MYSNTIAWSFGTDKKKFEFVNKKDLEKPGPGNYERESFNKIKRKIESFSFSKFPKFSRTKSLTPGPGYYVKSTENLFGKGGPGYTIGKTTRPKEPLLASSLGTGTISSTSFTTAVSTTPGPGRYSVDISTVEKAKTKSPSFKIGTSTKVINYNNNIPGPGHYSPNQKVIKSTSPGWSLPTSKKINDHFVPKSALLSPGPAMYRSKSEIEFNRTGGFTFGNVKKLPQMKSDVPGPASYFIPSSIGYTPSYSRKGSKVLI
jgi:hypothetical protein